MFKELYLKPVYNSEYEDVADSFFVPVLKHAVKFDRVSAYFSAKALALYANGLERFGQKGHTYRLIISKEISSEDFEEIRKGYELNEKLSLEMINELRQELSLAEEKNISNLAYLISLGVVDIRIAFKTKGIFHDKCGIVTDSQGEKICFRGSNNETEAAVLCNYEAFQVVCSWLDSNGFYLSGIRETEQEFEKLWNNDVRGIIVLPAQKVILEEIIRHNKGKIIMEEVLLRENAAVLDYNGQLVLHVNTCGMNWLINNTLYKIRLRTKVEKIVGDTIVFKSGLSYLEYMKLDTLLSQKIPALGVEYYVTKRFKEYIEARNLFIEKRAKLGIEMKTNAIRLEERYKKFADVVNAGMTRKLREQQMADAFFMYAMTKAGNFSVPGSGKTSSVLGVYRFLKENDVVDRILMIGPKNSFGSWIDEFRVCFAGIEELRCFNIQNTGYTKTSDKRRALQYNSGDCNLLLFNYECLGTYENELKAIAGKRTLLVFDEVHKVKKIDGEYSSHALFVAEDAGYVIAMTGTPLPNSYQDIYNFLHILFRDEYEDFFGFDVTMLKNPSPDEMELINEKLQPFFCRTSKQQLSVPPVNPDIIYALAVTKEEQKLFEILCSKYRKNKLALFIRILQLETNPNMLLKTLDISEFRAILDLSDDIDAIDFVDYSDEVVKLINSIGTTTKKKACIDETKRLVAEGKKVIIWCIFKDSIASISQCLIDNGINAKCIYGAVPLEERLQLIEDFRSGKYDVLLTNPHTLAESVSLHSVCHDAIYYEYSYNLVHLLQSKDRIHRLGLPDGQYTQYYYFQNWYDYNEKAYSLDANIYQRLRDKERIMLDAIDNQHLEAVCTPEEDLELIFGEL